MENGKEIENNGVCSVESINGSRDVWSSKDSDSSSADHLVIMVNGILGSAADWKFGANQFVKALPDKVVVHCSERNSASLTLDGVDVMGDRLADEVLEVIKRNPNVRKISFIAHSVGGLVARYAIGKLYKPTKKETADSLSDELEKESGGTIAGLEAMNFITVATPHLGSRGNKNVPFLFGLTAIESLANCVIHWIFRRTGRHLFLNDDDEGKPPLLKRMLEDNGECYFLSALRTFKRRVIYSNMQYDHIVGWRTSSIRRICDLPKCEGPIDEKYPHIVREEHCPAIEGDHSEPTSSSVGGDSSVKLEEELVTGLSRLSWEKVDVNFRSSSQKFAAHSVIQVKDEVAHIDGADVIQHMIDRFLT